MDNTHSLKRHAPALWISRRNGSKGYNGMKPAFIVDRLLFTLPEGEKQVKSNFLWKRAVVAAAALAVAALACSAPAGQQSPASPSAEVAQAVTNTPYVVTATPQAVVVTATPGADSSASGGTTGGSTGSTTGGATGGSTGSTTGGSTGGTTGGTTGGSTGSTSGGTGGSDCAYDSQFVADLTVPDGTNMLLGSAFTKTSK